VQRKIRTLRGEGGTARGLRWSVCRSVVLVKFEFRPARSFVTVFANSDVATWLPQSAVGLISEIGCDANLATYVPCMRNSNLQIMITGSSYHPQIIKFTIYLIN